MGIGSAVLIVTLVAAAIVGVLAQQQVRKLEQKVTSANQTFRNFEKKMRSIELSKIGRIYSHFGQYKLAIEFQQQSLDIARQIGYRQGEADSLGNLGNAYRNLGQYQRAIEFHQQSLEIARQIGDRQGEADSFSNLGNAYRNLGQ